MNGSEGLPESYDYDLIIVGGGSGGLAAAKARLLCVIWVMGRSHAPDRRPPVLTGIRLSHSCDILHLNSGRTCLQRDYFVNQFSRLNCTFFMKVLLHDSTVPRILGHIFIHFKFG